MNTDRSRRPTITDVARLANVSIKSASRVVNGVPTVSPDIQTAVLKAINELGYRSNRGAASLRSGRSNIAAFIVRDISNPFYGRLVAGAEEVAERSGLLILTASSKASPVRQASLADALFEYRPAVLLVTPAGGQDAVIQREFTFGTPIVAIDEPLEGIDCDVVAFDNHADSRRAVGIALDSGWKELGALVDSDGLASMPERLSGAQDALTSRGMPPMDQSAIRRAHTVDEARHATIDLLRENPRTETIFCGNNVLAAGALEEIARSGADIGLIVFDPLIAGQSLSVPAIAIEHEAKDIGRLGMSIALERLTNRDLPIRRTSLPTWISTNRSADQGTPQHPPVHQHQLREHHQVSKETRQ